MALVAGCAMHILGEPEEVPAAHLVAAAMEDRLAPASRPLSFTPSEPVRLRPCCAFGLDLHVRIGPVPVPSFTLETVRGPGDLGQHSYGAGLVQLAESPVAREPGQPAHENNGIVYTCRGGFIDIAHVRDFADLTAYLAWRIEQQLPAGGTIELADLGGTRRIVIRPIGRDVLRRRDRTAFAIAAAEWLTFELSVWREIATWYGHESVPPWPEKISTFSIEDLYSNVLGTKLAGGILSTRPVESEAEYDRDMGEWLQAALAQLQVVPKDSAAAAMRAVDGSWWDSRRKVPDWKVLRRRKFDIGADEPPWLVQMAAGDAAASRVGCSGADRPIVLHPLDHIGAIPIRDFASVEIEVDAKLARHGFPFPRRGDRHLTQQDFPSIVEDIRQTTNRAFGGHADRP